MDVVGRTDDCDDRYLVGYECMRGRAHGCARRDQDGYLSGAYVVDMTIDQRA